MSQNHMIDMLFLLSSDIRSEGSIAIVKKIDLDYLMVYDSISLPHPKMCFIKLCVCVCVCVCVSLCVCVCLSVCVTVAERRA